MDDRAETQRIEERLPQGTDERLARPWLSTRGAITPVAILQPLSSPVGDVVMYTSSVAGHNLRLSLGSSVAEARSHKTSAGSTSGRREQTSRGGWIGASPTGSASTAATPHSLLAAQPSGFRLALACVALVHRQQGRDEEARAPQRRSRREVARRMHSRPGAGC